MSDIALDPTTAAQTPADAAQSSACEIVPLPLHTISWGKCTLQFKTTLTLTPTLGEEIPRLLIAENPELCLHVFAATRADLIQEIHEQIVFMWQEYVKTDADDLAADGLRLRATLLNLLEEVA